MPDTIQFQESEHKQIEVMGASHSPKISSIIHPQSGVSSLAVSDISLDNHKNLDEHTSRTGAVGMMLMAYHEAESRTPQSIAVRTKMEKPAYHEEYLKQVNKGVTQWFREKLPGFLELARKSDEEQTKYNSLDYGQTRADKQNPNLSNINAADNQEAMRVFQNYFTSRDSGILIDSQKWLNNYYNNYQKQPDNKDKPFNVSDIKQTIAHIQKNADVAATRKVEIQTPLNQMLLRRQEAMHSGHTGRG